MAWYVGDTPVQDCGAPVVGCISVTPALIGLKNILLVAVSRGYRLRVVSRRLDPGEQSYSCTCVGYQVCDAAEPPFSGISPQPVVGLGSSLCCLIAPCLGYTGNLSLCRLKLCEPRSGRCRI